MRLARLKTRRDFLRVADTRARFVTPGLILQVRRHGEDEAVSLPPIRVGFTVSRKVGNAVVRNRVRRRLRAAADEVMARRAQPHRDYVLIGRRESEDRPYADLLADIETALARTGTLIATQTPVPESVRSA
jgi:ribonuclease P protein component